MRLTVIPTVTGAHGMIPQNLEREPEELEIGRRIEIILHYSIVKISWNCEKSPWELKRLGDTQNPVKPHQLTCVWRTHRERSNNHHHVVQLVRISLTLSRHLSLSSIVPGRSSKLHPLSAQNCFRYVLAGRPRLVRACEGVHRNTSLMSSPLLLQLCPTCLVCLIWMVFVKGGRWLYSCCLVGCCLQDLFNTARSVLM